MPDSLSQLREAALTSALRGCQLFSGLSPEDLGAIVPLITVKTLARGDYLFHEGEPATGFYVVQKGAVNVHRVSAAGKEQVIHVFRPGESFAEAALATERGYPADARALESSQVLLVQKTGFVALLKRRPELALRMLAAMSTHLRVLVAQLEDMTLKDVETRLANWLLKQCPRPHGGAAVEVRLAGTKRVLAAELGTVSETLSRTLAAFRERGLISVAGRSITVHSPEQLARALERLLDA